MIILQLIAAGVPGMHGELVLTHAEVGAKCAQGNATIQAVSHVLVRAL